jgi:diketogulonate reductase-like aldo/keto reductase
MVYAQPPASSCTHVQLIHVLDGLNAVCCPGNSCASSGVPTACRAACKTAWAGMHTSACLPALASALAGDSQAGSAGLIGQLDALCGAGSASTQRDAQHFTLANGQSMPAVSFGFEIYPDATATGYMATALQAGVRNFFASVLANNQVGVRAGINNMASAGQLARQDIFLCGSVTQCSTSLSVDACYTYTANLAARNLVDLGVSYLDQIMLDYPPAPDCNHCALILAQWKAFEEMIARGETRGLAVSNYCPCHLDCIIDAVNDPTNSIIVTKPLVNQLQYHVGTAIEPMLGTNKTLTLLL